MEFQKLGIRSVILRIGLVLSKEGGVLKKLYPIFKLFLGVPIGSGSQLISWIHINDMVNIINSGASFGNIESGSESSANFSISLDPMIALGDIEFKLSITGFGDSGYVYSNEIDFSIEVVTLLNYNPHPQIKGMVAI